MALIETALTGESLYVIVKKNPYTAVTVINLFIVKATSRISRMHALEYKSTLHL